MKGYLLAGLVACAVLLPLGVSAAAGAEIGPHEALGSTESNLESTRGDEASDWPESAWHDYHRSVLHSLTASNSPLDWALAANMFTYTREEIGTLRPDHVPLLDRAARAAPDNPLVQWLVANDRDVERGYLLGVDRASAIAALQRLEPDNAASWMIAVGHAPPDDAALIDELLAHMASSARYNDHFVDAAHAWIEAYGRFPLPEPLWGDVRKANNGSVRWLSATALAQASVIPFPDFRALVVACDPSRPANGSWQRRAYCEDAGRLMLTRGDTYLSRSIGFALLRNLGAATDEDQALRTNLSWLFQRYLGAVGYGTGDELAVAAYEQDWQSLDDEIEIWRRAVVRAGLPDKAPPGWVPRVTSTAGNASN